MKSSITSSHPCKDGTRETTPRHIWLDAVYGITTRRMYSSLGQVRAMGVPELRMEIGRLHQVIQDGRLERALCEAIRSSLTWAARRKIERGEIAAYFRRLLDVDDADGDARVADSTT